MLYNIKDFTKELNLYNTIEFKKLNNYDNYFIYEDGRVFSIKRNRFLKQTTEYNGYNRIRLSNNDNKGKVFLVHRLVYETFKGPIPDNLQVDHINGIRNDNRLINLRLLTLKENNNNRHYLEQYKEIEKKIYMKTKEYKKEYYIKNKEKIREWGYKYREENKEKRKEQNKKYREEHREELKTYFKKYYEDHKKNKII